MWFQKEQETPTLPSNAEAVWETLQSLTMLEKNRTAIETLNEQFHKTRRHWRVSIIALWIGLILSAGTAGWTTYQLHQLQQQITTDQSQ